MARSILVTGGAGYIGSHTVVELLESGDDVIVVDNLDNSSIKAVEQVQQIAGRDLVFVEADITDEHQVEKIFANHQVDAVIHFAALKAVGESVAQPLRYYRNNLGSTLTLLDVMARHGVHDFVFSSSCTVYGEPEVVPVSEQTPRVAVSPYGQTKLMIEHILEDLAASNPDWRIVLLRYFNPVGAHPSGRIGEDPTGIPNNLMPFITQVAVGRRDELAVFGDDYETRDGTCIRDFIHVVDLARGHLAALDAIDELGSGAHAFNLGSGTGSTVLEVIAAAEKAVGALIPHRIVGRREGDAAVVFADPTAANRALRWSTTKSLDEMCADHWRWQKQNPDGYASPGTP